MVIEKNRVVSIDYKLVDDDGDLIDSSDEGEPLVYLHGNGNIIPGLEKQLEGKKEGDSLACVLAPVDAYGERDESLVFAVGKDEFEGSELEVGMQFEAHGESGAQIVTVVSIEGDEDTSDYRQTRADAGPAFRFLFITHNQETLPTLLYRRVEGRRKAEDGQLRGRLSSTLACLYIPPLPFL